ncbi:Hypothetical protein HDN1F_12060 [gamma proteobacterium HdN1]|nr:Hypothetical protein HDN1F_12060 [gamma proteobacterium HdN1]
MNTPEKSLTPALEAALLQRGDTFSYLQAYRLLAQALSEQGNNPETALRLRPALSLALPRAAIQQISTYSAESSVHKSSVEQSSAEERSVEERSAENARETPSENKSDEYSQSQAHNPKTSRYEIQANFLGLYGASSPLPNFYTEDLITGEQEDQLQARQLLDIFHQRAYHLYAAALQKYRPIYELTSPKQSHFRQLLWALVGAREDTVRRALKQPGLILQYAAWFTRPQKSAAGLHAILSAWLTDLNADQYTPIEVIQCEPQRLSIPTGNLLALGTGNTAGFGNAAGTGKALGIDTVLGTSIIDYSGKLLVRLGPLSTTTYRQLVPEGHPCHEAGVGLLIRTYIGPSLNCDLEFLVTPTPSTPITLQLGEPTTNPLGLGSWLGAPADATPQTHFTARLRLQ